MSAIVELLPVYGPWLLFVLAILETSFVTGLVVPSGLATAAATALALDGQLALGPVAVAAACGGAVGDTLGFWIGRAFGARVLRGDGRLARALGRKRQVDLLFERHPIYSVTLARLISFVRTVMPMAAGMSGLPYRHYLPYELAGLTAWVGMYVSIGMIARESWQVATRVIGVGGTLVFVAVGLVAWQVWRRRARAVRAPAGDPGL